MKKKGFTMIEAMFVVVLSGFLLVALNGLFLQVNIQSILITRQDKIEDSFNIDYMAIAYDFKFSKVKLMTDNTLSTDRVELEIDENSIFINGNQYNFDLITIHSFDENNINITFKKDKYIFEWDIKEVDDE